MADKFITRDELITLIKDVTGPAMAEAVEEQVRKAVEPLTKQQTDLFGRIASGLESKAEPPKPEAGAQVAQMLRACAAAKGDPQRAAEWAKKQGFHDAVVKALAATDAAAGGFLVPTQFAQDIIQLLRPQSIVRLAGPQIITMTTGKMSIPKVATGSAATYIGENANIGMTAPTFGQVNLMFKKLAALVPVSNDLLRQSSPGADTIVRDDVVRAMAQGENAAFLRADGTGAAPKGIRYWANSSNVFATAGTALANIITDLSTAILKLKNNDVPFTRPAWFLNPRSWNTLMTIQTSTGTGNYVFRQEMLGGLNVRVDSSGSAQTVYSAGMLWGIPYYVSTAVPANLGAGTATEVYLVDMADVVIGESQTLIVDASTEAAYYDGSTVQAAYSLDQTVVRAIAEHDLVMRRDVSAAVVTGVGW